ncbi:S8 family serine peptidase [Arthrobacter sp. STN4]|uniref:S8 family peptidase n=1 Tax=Arthrobacter sp. STN4 TaxID=2923276 RepID=UPI0035C10CC5
MPQVTQPPKRRLRGLCAALLALGMVVPLALAGAGAASADDIRNREYWLGSSGITKAWTISQGQGVKVAVIDSGIDAAHIDLKGAVVGGADMSGSGNAKGTKGVGAEPEHGTLVATMLAGRGHASASAGATATKSATAAPTAGAGPDGVIGVAPKAELLSVSVWLGSDNPSGKTIDAQIPAAVRWAVDHGARVINMSLGSTSTAWPQSWDSAFAYAEAKDVVIVAAAGNRKSGSEQVGAPATIPGVLAVGGLDKDGVASVDSSSQGISIGVAAPAEDLAGGLPGGGYARWSGTSGAAPIVSGVAALIRAKYPKMSAAQVINRIITTAKPKGNGIPNAFYGYGVLDAYAALTADVPVVQANPLGSIKEWIHVHRRGEAAPPTGGSTVTTSPLPAATFSDHAVPAPLPPAQLSSVAPAAIVLGFLALLVVVLAAGGTHVLLVRRRLLAEEAGRATAGPAAGSPGTASGTSGTESGTGAGRDSGTGAGRDSAVGPGGGKS